MHFVLQANYVNVPHIELEKGKRYHICVHAKETDLVYETFTQHLDTVSACSNGVTVDLNPPIPGTVWIGDHTKHQLFQVTFSIMCKLLRQ